MIRPINKRPIKTAKTIIIAVLCVAASISTRIKQSTNGPANKQRPIKTITKMNKPNIAKITNFAVRNNNLPPNCHKSFCLTIFPILSLILGKKSSQESHKTPQGIYKAFQTKRDILSGSENSMDKTVSKESKSQLSRWQSLINKRLSR